MELWKLSESQWYLIGFGLLIVWYLVFWRMTGSFLISGVITVAFSGFEWSIGLLPSQQPPIPWVSVLIFFLMLALIMFPPHHKDNRLIEGKDAKEK